MRPSKVPPSRPTGKRQKDAESDDDISESEKPQPKINKGATPEKPATRRTPRKKQKDVEPDDDVSEPEKPQPERKERSTRIKQKKVEHPDRPRSPAQTGLQPLPRAKRRKTSGSPFVHVDPDQKFHTSVELNAFLESNKLPPKRALKTSAKVEWDEEANRPILAIRTGSGKAGTYIQQTPVPLQQDRLIQAGLQSAAATDVSQAALVTETSRQTHSIAPSDLPDFIVEEIDALLKLIETKVEAATEDDNHNHHGTLSLLDDFSQTYTEIDFEKDTWKKRGKTNDPKNQTSGTCLNDTARPFSSISEIFEDIANKASSMGFLRACEAFQKQGLHVVTMCSGTESPLIALDLVKRAFKDKSHLLNVRHIASAEIEPFKQAYIQRNFDPEILFRDVTEFCDADAKPHTAFGGTAEQPDKVHILVAGSSCIDYSTLNNWKKDFGEKGQSFSTLSGITNYCLQMKPAVVILENVDSAPWSQILELYRAIGYVGLCYKVDTKDFYLPQTRTRGYIVAFHVSKAVSKGFNLKEMFETVTTSLQTFRQRATVPYAEFIYNDDDPDLSIARHKFVTSAKTTRETVRSWTACRHRYAAYRAENQLGFGRPYSQWRANGSCLPPDIAWVDWVQVQRERIWDTLDINFLLYLRQREYDMSYKSRWIELSQNVDRDTDQRHWGITGCLTPSGMPMDSRRGGPVSGRESLALQGIPADKLLLNKESSGQLQDLAGNAMTTTVVGSVIFSAIIASMKKEAINNHKALEAEDSIFEHFDNVKPYPLEPVFELQNLDDIQAGADRWELKTTGTPESHYQPPKMMNVGRIAASAMQLCRCEGALGKANSRILVCHQCGHTCCAACKGSPQHDYDEASNLRPELLKSRATARAFYEFVQKEFPPAIDLVETQYKKNVVAIHIEMLRSHLDMGKLLKSKFTTTEETEAYLTAISESLQHTLVFSGIKRDKVIRIVYESSTARLEFHVQFDLTKWLAERQEWAADLVECTWLVFAKLPKEAGAGSPLREVLETPILKMVPKDYLLDGELDFNTFEEQQLKLKISPHSPHQEIAWESTFGIQHPVYRNIQKWPELQVEVVEPNDDCIPVAQAINGIYRSLSACGGASGTLHVKLSSDTDLKVPQSRPQLSGLFLFLDPAPFRNAKFDSMVFSNIHERLPYSVPRRVKSVIRPPWRPIHLQQTDHIDAITEDIWKASGLLLKASERAGVVTVLGPTNAEVSLNSRVCGNYFSITACRLPRFQHDSATFPKNKTLLIELVDRPEALKTLQWLLRSKWSFATLQCWHNILYSPGLVDDTASCDCCPQPPRLKWRLATAAIRNDVIIKPFEDEQAASEYEKKLKAVPVPAKAFLNCHQNEMYLDLKLNLDSVVHRVLTTLLPGRSGKISLQWRLKKDDGLDTVPIFKNVSVPGYESTDTKIGLTPGLQPSCELRPWQKQSAYWIEQQELDSVRWHEFERLEYKLPALEQRLDVQGNKEVSIKGGILADSVGSGKTLTSMVLPAREAVTNQGPDQTHQPGLLPLKATIFLIPHTLFKQWREEKEKYVDKKVNCVYIRYYSDLARCTIKKFQDAHFIFVSWQLFDANTTATKKSSPSSYWNELRKTINAFNVPILAGRGFNQWLEEASNDLRDLVADSTVNGSIDLDRFNRARKEKLETLKAKYKDSFSAFRKSDDAVSSTRGSKKSAIVKKGIAGAAKQLENRQTENYQPAQPQARDDKKGALDCDAAEFAEKDLEKLTPLLHMFSYRRLIVDEFTYLRDHTVSGIIHLSAPRRWMLSGTPPLHNYVSISYMAKLLGTKITPQGDDDSLIDFMKANKALVHDKSSAEEFQQQLETQTPAWIRKRDERAEAFVKQFVRQNHREVGEKREIRYEVKDLSLIETYLYTKAFQSVNGQVRETEKVDGVKLQSKAIMDRDAAFIKYHQQKKSAVGTIVWCLHLLLGEYTGAFSETSENHNLTILRGLIKEKDEEFGSHVEQVVLLLARALKAWQGKQASLKEKAAGKRVAAAAKAEDEDEDEESEEEERRADAEEGQDVLGNKEDGKNNPLAVYLENVLDHNFGDRSVSEMMSRVAKACSLALGDLPKAKNGDEKVGGQKKLATDLNTLTREAVQIAQERRLLRQVLELGLDQEGTRKCHGCERELTPSHLAVMSQCGHLVCTGCLDSENCPGEKLNGCPVRGCSGPGKDSSTPAVHFSSPTSEVKSGGTRVPQVLQVLGTIRREEPEERVLVFVQGQFKKELAATIAKGFGGDAGVVVDATAGSDAAVSKFGKDQKARVLILPIDDINAAGWNLQSCNHVVFTHPYVSQTKADWEATMEQAVGRCARHGQDKTVHVYHLLASATLEMEIIQVRSGGRLVRRRLTGGDVWTFRPGMSPDLSAEVVGPRLGSVRDEEEGDEGEEEREEDEEE